MKRNFIEKMRNKHLSPVQLLAVGFASVIITGAILLNLPIASKTGVSIGALAALFTSTSCVCVTGLIVVDTATTFTLFGQIVIISLIQIGGLGFMTAAVSIYFLIGRRISLRDRVVMQEALNEESLQGLVKITRRAIFITFAIEFVGMVILAFRFVPQFGLKGLWYALFHAISAFCNAGFDLMGNFDSLVHYVNDPLVTLTIAFLIIIGGIGFTIVADIYKHRHFSRLSLNTKIVLLVTGALILLGTIFVFVAESSNPLTIGDKPLGVKILASFFQSVTARTAGFNTIDQASITNGTILVTIILMFIGASPASTGGGIKTTTLAVLILLVRSVVRGKPDVECFEKRLPNQLILRAVAIICLYLLGVVIVSSAISVLESAANNQISLSSIVYEVTSAFGTVGITIGITRSLTNVSKMLIILSMYAGRIGPLSLMMAFAAKARKDSAHLRYSEEKIMVG